MTTSGFELFGSGIRTKSLIAISVMEETHVPEIARILGAGTTTIRNAVETLEAAGVVVGSMEGNTRRVRLNPRFRAYDALRALLEQLALGEIALLEAISKERRRPRKTGKRL